MGAIAAALVSNHLGSHCIFTGSEKDAGGWGDSIVQWVGVLVLYKANPGSILSISYGSSGVIPECCASSNLSITVWLQNQNKAQKVKNDSLTRDTLNETENYAFKWILIFQDYPVWKMRNTRGIFLLQTWKLLREKTLCQWSGIFGTSLIFHWMLCLFESMIDMDFSYLAWHFL